MRTAFVVRPDDAAWEDLGAGGKRSDIKSLVGPDQSDTIAAGLCVFEDSSFDWTLAYDEIVHVLEGTVEVQVGEERLRGEAGDVLFIPDGSQVTYVFQGLCRLFFAAYPADWQQRTEVARG
jgi:ethanolamine utilization protein EutQ